MRKMLAIFLLLSIFLFSSCAAQEDLSQMGIPIDADPAEQLAPETDLTSGGADPNLEPFPGVASTPEATPTPAAKKVGISLPGTSNSSFAKDGELLQSMLLTLGYEAEIQHAQNDAQTQLEQIQIMLLHGCDLILLAAVDDATLDAAFDTAKTLDVPIITYGYPSKSASVDYFVSFDYRHAGKLQGEFIRDALHLDTALGPYRMEIFAGTQENWQAKEMYEGAMEVLQPYLDAGKLLVPSDKIAQADSGVGSQAMAQARMKGLLRAIDYGPTSGVRLDAVLALDDSLAVGVALALIEAGYNSSQMPILTGSGCTIDALANILSGHQSMSVLLDERQLAAQAAAMINSLLKSESVFTNNGLSFTLDNGETIVILAQYLEPLVCTAENLESLLIYSSYYLREELGLNDIKAE
ncbi:substrate-binding domain-containing protein [Eubacteriales bacterium OttesenSCG-928-K08]|nr:substrate-binding domain-containing protein [Eubacteriales bacterium OttesenSCG-928-K08]